MLVAAMALGACLLTGCGVISAIHKAVKTVEGNKATVDAFTSNIKTTKTATFEVTYTTTGSSPAKVVYAVDSPSHELAFTDTPSSAGSTNHIDIVVNASGEYACTPPSTGSGSTWTCQELPKTSAADENNILDFYTASHWVKFLNGFALVAGIAGDKVTNSTMTVNGFSMKCLDFQTSATAKKSTICTTPQGLLGYVKVATDSTSFEITNYSSSPTSSLFKLPPGAKITKVTVTTTTAP
jgi:hypothetical protein